VSARGDLNPDLYLASTCTLQSSTSSGDSLSFLNSTRSSTEGKSQATEDDTVSSFPQSLFTTSPAKASLRLSVASADDDHTADVGQLLNLLGKAAPEVAAAGVNETGVTDEDVTMSPMSGATGTPQGARAIRRPEVRP